MSKDKRAKEFIIDESEEFIFYVKRYLYPLFSELKYEMFIEYSSICTIITFLSRLQKRKVKLTYDFLRSDRIYYRIRLDMLKKRVICYKEKIIEPLNYVDDREEPKTVDQTILMIKEVLKSNFCSDLKSKLT